jgi:lipoprotein NlpI
VANLYFEAADLRLARLHYEIAAEIEPDFPNLYFNLGLVHAMNEDYKAAVAALSNYKELAPDPDDTNADELLVSLRKSIDTP